MSDLTNRIDMVLTNNKIKRADLCRGVGISDSTIRQWIRGSSPSVDAVYKVAQFLNVTLEWLVTGEDKESGNKIILSQLENDLIEVFRHLDDRDQNAVITLAKSLESQYCVQESQKDSLG